MESLSKHSDADDVNTPPDACRALTYTCAIELDVFEDLLLDVGGHGHLVAAHPDVRATVDEALGCALNEHSVQGGVTARSKHIHIHAAAVFSGNSYEQCGKQKCHHWVKQSSTVFTRWVSHG